MSEFAAPKLTESFSLAIPDELVGPTPRPLPYKVALGRAKKTARRNATILQVLGVFCWIAAPIPFIRILSLYFLPLQWLGWLGLLLFGIGIWLVIDYIFNKRRFWAIIHGSAGVGRVVELAKAPTLVQDGQATTYAFFAAVETVNPETGQQERLNIQSAQLSAMNKDTTQTNFRVGDEVVLVWRPGKFQQTCTIYDFLELVPEHQLNRRGETTQSPLTEILLAIGMVLLISLFFFALFWNIYALGRYSSFSMEWKTGGAIGGIGGCILASLTYILIRALTRYEKRKLAVRNEQAAVKGEAVELAVEADSKRSIFGTLFLGAGAILLCGLTVTCWALTINAWFDGSVPTPMPINVHERVMVTHNFIFREYKLKYSFPGSTDKHDLMLTPLRLFQVTEPQSIAFVREGYFGWKWIEDVEGIGNQVDIDLGEP